LPNDIASIYHLPKVIVKVVLLHASATIWSRPEFYRVGRNFEEDNPDGKNGTENETDKKDLHRVAGAQQSPPVETSLQQTLKRSRSTVTTARALPLGSTDIVQVYVVVYTISVETDDGRSNSGGAEQTAPDVIESK